MGLLYPPASTNLLFHLPFLNYLTSYFNELTELSLTSHSLFISDHPTSVSCSVPIAHPSFLPTVACTSHLHLHVTHLVVLCFCILSHVTSSRLCLVGIIISWSSEPEKKMLPSEQHGVLTLSNATFNHINNVQRFTENSLKLSPMKSA